jgi:hypothetical protein
LNFTILLNTKLGVFRRALYFPLFDALGLPAPQKIKVQKLCSKNKFQFNEKSLKESQISEKITSVFLDVTFLPNLDPANTKPAILEFHKKYTILDYIFQNKK